MTKVEVRAKTWNETRHKSGTTPVAHSENALQVVAITVIYSTNSQDILEKRRQTRGLCLQLPDSKMTESLQTADF